MNGVALNAEAKATASDSVLAAKAVIRESTQLSDRQKELFCKLVHDLYCLGYANGVEDSARSVLKDLAGLSE